MLVRQIAKIIRSHDNDSDTENYPDLSYLLLETADKIKTINPKSKTVSWIVPAFGQSSGGQMTICRVAQYLETQGYKNTFYVIPPYFFKTAEEAKTVLYKNYLKFENADLKYIDKDHLQIIDSEYLIVTSWETAYYGRNIANAKNKIYFVQDFEPYFYPQSSQYIFAENTYKMDYKYIAASEWLDQKLSTEYKRTGRHINLGYDSKEYLYRIPFTQRENAVCFYSRFATYRRGSELGLLALALAKEKLPELNIYLYGNPSIPMDNFGFTNLGILDHTNLNLLYNRCKLGLAFSLTNYSLIPQEMNASGLPVIELDLPGNRINYNKREGVILVEPEPQQLAEKIVELIQNQDVLSKLAETSLTEVKDYKWENILPEFEKAMLELSA